ncbi:MAG: metal-dependent transcriptional regulator, partial [Rhodoglobus sp.]|nr:metal-dependent transcriptional regulator [Rhodoglobus sp.]
TVQTKTFDIATLADLKGRRAGTLKGALAERLLADVIGLDWAYVHDEACRWEHVMSEQVERRLLVMLDHPTESPYGNPIPGLEELGDAPAPAFMDGVINLVELVAGSAGPVTRIIRRLGEPVQFEPELLQQLQNAGVMPGATATISAAGSYVVMQVDGFGEGLELPDEVAVHIFAAR